VDRFFLVYFSCIRGGGVSFCLVYMGVMRITPVVLLCFSLSFFP
jgi:hypothetical protein